MKTTHDIEMRNILKEKYLSKYNEDSASMVVDELGLFWGQSRIDVAVINGHLWGYEIKSEADNFSRLEFQMQSYNQVFDYLTLVVHESHLQKALSEDVSLPPWWGIISVSGSPEMLKSKIVKKPRINRTTNSDAILHLLWKNEIISILDSFGIKYKKSYKKSDLYKIATEFLPKNTIKKLVSSTLRSRPSWRVVQEQA